MAEARVQVQVELFVACCSRVGWGGYSYCCCFWNSCYWTGGEVKGHETEAQMRSCWEMCRISLPGERRSRWSRWFIHGAYVSSREPALPEQCRSNERETKSGGPSEHCLCVSVHHWIMNVPWSLNLGLYVYQPRLLLHQSRYIWKSIFLFMFWPSIHTETTFLFSENGAFRKSPAKWIKLKTPLSRCSVGCKNGSILKW